jgi:hypothetical protein
LKKKKEKNKHYKPCINSVLWEDSQCILNNEFFISFKFTYNTKKKKYLNLGSVQKLFILPEIFYYWIILIKVVRSKVGKTK